MATRSTIRIQTPEFKSNAIYCHWDGNPSNMIPLLKNFGTLKKAKELINLGDLSSLGNSIDSTIAYCRDMHETKNWGGEERQQYNYLFTGKTWLVI